MKKLLEIKNLRKIYHTKKDEILAVDDFSFDLYEGEFVSIVGPSGCGKSTILSILCGLINHSDGKIVFNDNSKIGYMLQEDCLFDFRNILDNCLIGLEINNQLNNKTKDTVEKLLKEYELYEFKDKYPNNLSGGMRQRVALIRTLATNPDILLLDEPFSALDYQTRINVANDVYSIIKKEKKSAIMVTHNIEEACMLSDKIIVLTNRPCKIKNIYMINLDKNNPIDKKKDPKFNYYYDLIWRDIESNV